MDKKSGEKMKWTLDEILSEIKTIYEEGRSYSDAELQGSLAAITGDLKTFFKYSMKQTDGSGSPVVVAISTAYNSFSESVSQLLSNNLLFKKHLEDEDLEMINKALVRIDEDLTALRMKIEQSEGL